MAQVALASVDISGWLNLTCKLEKKRTVYELAMLVSLGIPTYCSGPETTKLQHGNTPLATALKKMLLAGPELSTLW